MQLTLDRFGRMVLPKAIRDGLDIRAGDVMDVETEGDCVVLRPVREQGAVRTRDGVQVFTGDATGDLRDAVTTHRRERLRDLAAGAGQG